MEEFLNSFDTKESAKLYRLIALLSENGTDLRNLIPNTYRMVSLSCVRNLLLEPSVFFISLWLGNELYSQMVLLRKHLKHRAQKSKEP